MGCTLAQYRSSIGCYCGGSIGASLFCDFAKIKNKVHVNINKKGMMLLYNVLIICWTLPLIWFTTNWLYAVLCTYKVVKTCLVNVKINALLLLNGMRLLLLLLILLLLLLCGDIHPNPGPPYYNNNSLSICHCNIRSLNSHEKINHIELDLSEHFNFDVITISETWLKSTSNSNILNLRNYHTPFRKDRSDNSGYGGVLAWVRKEIFCKRRKDLELLDLEALWLELRLFNVKLLVCTA